MRTDKQEENKVVSLFERPKSPKSEKSDSKEDESFDFENIMKRNSENKMRQQKERAKSNRGVIRSYRLKH